MNGERAPRALGSAVVAWMAALVVVPSIGLAPLRDSSERRFTVQSSGMSPTLKVGDHISVDTSGPCCSRGDVVVFRNDRNPGWRSVGSVYNIKRIVGRAGDTVTQCDANRVCIDGEVVDEHYLPKRTRSVFPALLPHRVDATGEQQLACEATSPPGGCTVPHGMVFVLGDNRMNSQDSRSNGPVTLASVLGPAHKVA